MSFHRTSKGNNMAIEERYQATMVLGGVGDALGYKNGEWEFCTSGITMYEKLLDSEAGRIDKIYITKKGWPVSDDTLLHIATAESLIDHGDDLSRERLYSTLARKYVEAMQSKDMQRRHPGNTCMLASDHLSKALKGKLALIPPFDKRGGGCGASMRSMCIGMVYCTAELKNELVAISIESGRLTHHHPTGYLGSLASALFTSYALQDKPLREWGKGLIDTLDEVNSYIIERGIDVERNIYAIDDFKKRWMDYLEVRGITDGQSEPRFPKSYGLYERDMFYRSISYDGTGGASGHDAPMIAYDALMGAGKDWEELCLRGMIHGGDSDSTGTIAGALYGAMYGFEDVPKINHQAVEFRKRLDGLGEKLFELAQKIKPDVPVHDELQEPTRYGSPRSVQDGSQKPERGVSGKSVRDRTKKSVHDGSQKFERDGSEKSLRNRAEKSVHDGSQNPEHDDSPTSDSSQTPVNDQPQTSWDS